MRKNRKKAETYRFNGHPTLVELESRIADLEAKLADTNDPDAKGWTARWLKRYETEMEKKSRGLALKESERTDSRRSKQTPDHTALP